MNDDVIVVSTAYTGTRFTKKSFNLKRHVHTFDSPWYIHGKTAIIPIKRPETNWKSFARRNAGTKWDNYIALFNRAWMGLAWYVAANYGNYYFLPLDKPGVEERMKEIADTLQLDLIPNVPHIGAEDKGIGEHPHDVSWMYLSFPFLNELYRPDMAK